MTIRDLARPLSPLGWCFVVLLIVVRGAYAASSCSADCPGDINNDRMVTVDEILGAVNAALSGCPPVGPTPSSGGGLLQTGQTQCDQGTGMLGACPGSPAGQDGAVGAGVSLSYTDNADGTVHDNVTGLTWEKLSDHDDIHDWDNTYTWYDAFAMKIAALNAPPCFAAHCDWRLPNRRELESLVDAGQISPAIDPAFNTGCAPECTVTTCSCTKFDGVFYWSSTTVQDPNQPGFAWAVDDYDGRINGFEKGVVPLYVRAVRGGVGQVVNEPHSAIAVPGSFSLGQQNAESESIAVFVKSSLPPFAAVRLMESVHYTLTPVLSSFDIHVLTLPSQFVVPGAYDFFVSYSFAN